MHTSISCKRQVSCNGVRPTSKEPVQAIAAVAAVYEMLSQLSEADAGKHATRLNTVQPKYLSPDSTQM